MDVRGSWDEVAICGGWLYQKDWSSVGRVLPNIVPPKVPVAKWAVEADRLCGTSAGKASSNLLFLGRFE